MELVDSKSKAVVRLVEDFVCGWVEVAFSCNKRVVAEGLEALDLRLKFGTPSGSGIEECLPACLFVISLERVGSEDVPEGCPKWLLSITTHHLWDGTGHGVDEQGPACSVAVTHASVLRFQSHEITVEGRILLVLPCAIGFE